MINFYTFLLINEYFFLRKETVFDRDSNQLKFINNSKIFLMNFIHLSFFSSKLKFIEFLDFIKLKI